MTFFIKLKINNIEEGFINQDDIVNFIFSRNIENILTELTLEINNVEKYLNLFLTKVNFFQLTVIINNTTYDFETFYPRKSELKGSKIILICHNINFDLTQISYNRILSNQSLKNILIKLANELEVKNALLDYNLRNVQIDKLEQKNKTNLALLEELNEIFYAYVYLNHDNLMFLKPTSYNPDIFRDTPNAIINDNKIIYINKSYSAYKVYKGIKCKYLDISSNVTKILSLGIEPYLEVKSPYNKELSNTLTKSKYEKLKEKELLELTVSGDMIFNTDMYIMIPVNTLLYQQFIGVYFINSIQYKFDAINLTTHIVAYKVY